MDYPKGIDCVWLGEDRGGKLAAMVTAGEAPIPHAAMEGPCDLFDIEGLLLNLPPLSAPKQNSDYGDVLSFSELASRGLYVYDWTDVHKVKSQMTRSYELVAEPAVLLPKFDLPTKLRGVTVHLKEAFFGAPSITIEQLR